MKIRTGFVSNSSSSSFICIIGKITDEDKLNDYIRSKNHKLPIWNERFYGHELEDAFENVICDFESRVYLDKNLDPNDRFIVFSEAGNEGDYEFYSNPDDDYSDLDYDIDFDFFSDDVQELAVLTPEKHGVQIINVIYYAGRNG